MRLSRLPFLVTIGAFLVVAQTVSSAHAQVTMNFEALRHNDGAITSVPSPYIESGFQISGPNLVTVGTLEGVHFPGSTSIYTNNPGATVLLSKVGGGRSR